jgi:hypothetical protein
MMFTPALSASHVELSELEGRLTREICEAR